MVLLTTKGEYMLNLSEINDCLDIRGKSVDYLSVESNSHQASQSQWILLIGMHGKEFKIFCETREMAVELKNKIRATVNA